MAWQKTYMTSRGLPRSDVTASRGDVTDTDRLTPDRKQKINEALDWLREELVSRYLGKQGEGRQLASFQKISEHTLARPT